MFILLQENQFKTHKTHVTSLLRILFLPTSLFACQQKTSFFHGNVKNSHFRIKITLHLGNLNTFRSGEATNNRQIRTKI